MASPPVLPVQERPAAPARPAPTRRGPRATTRGQESRRLGVLLATAAALLVGAFALITWRDHVDALEEGWSSAERGALGVAEHAAGALAAALTITDRVEQTLRRDGPERFRGAGWEDLGGYARHAPQVGSLWVLDIGGSLLASSLLPAPPPANFADRPFFAPLRDGAETYLAPLLWGRVSQVWFFSLNRAVRDAQGGFLGIVQAAMHAEDFHRVHAGLGLGTAASVGLFRADDGAPLMLWPLSAPRPGEIPDAAQAPAARALGGVTRMAAPEGRMASADAPGGPVLVAWRAVNAPGGMVAVAAVSRQQALAPFRARLQRNMAVLALSATALGTLAWAVFAAQRRGTEARRAAEAGQRELAAMLEATSDGVIALDAQGRVTFLNGRAAAQLGPLGLDLLGAPLWERCPEAIGGPFWQAWHEALRTGMAAAAESRCDALGSDFHAEGHRRADGGVVIFFHDVTEARAARARLAESEARFRATFEQAAVGMAQVGLDGRFLDVNERLSAILGYPREELLALRFQDLTHPDDLADDVGRVEALLAGKGERFAMEKRYHRKDGTPVWAMLTVALLRDAAGRPERFVSVVEDISARRAAEAALRESEARFRTLMDAAPVMVWVTDAAGRCSFLNRRWYELTGQAEAEALGEGWLEATDPAERAATVAAVRTALGRQEAFRLEYRLRLRDGSLLWVINAGEPRHGAAGEFLGHVGAVFDIADRKEAEERQMLLAREVDHRARNALAVVQSIVGLTRAEDAAGFRQAVTGRVAAMARAHSLLSRERWDGAGLGEIVAQELEAYRGAEEGAGRVVIAGPPVALAAGAAQPLAMALHELATNAAKYGALSVREGQLAVRWWLDPAEGGLRLEWRETGGPPVAGPPTRRGFGSSIMAGTVERQLHGRAEFEWEPAGLVCRIALPPSQLRTARG